MWPLGLLFLHDMELMTAFYVGVFTGPTPWSVCPKWHGVEDCFVCRGLYQPHSLVCLSYMTRSWGLLFMQGSLPALLPDLFVLHDMGFMTALYIGVFTSPYITWSWGLLCLVLYTHGVVLGIGQANMNYTVQYIFRNEFWKINITIPFHIVIVDKIEEHAQDIKVLNGTVYVWFFVFGLFVLFWIARGIFQLSGDCHHYQWQGCKSRPMLNAYSF
jgi:hypothetical protein